MQISAKSLKDIACEIFSCHFSEEVTNSLADALVWTSLRGIDSHGIRLIPHYVNSVKAGRLNPSPDIKCVRESSSVCILDADDSVGHYVGSLAMKRATDLARVSGLAAVAVRNSSHCGALSYYSTIASNIDMCGVSLTHATPRVMTPNSTRAFFGNNPFAFTAPLYNEDPFCYDAATTAITFNAIKSLQSSPEGILPDNVAADKDGFVTRNPDKATQLLGIGEYKGFGMSMVVDVLCAILTDMPAGIEVSNMFTETLSEKRKLGQFYIAIDISHFISVHIFKENLSKLVRSLRAEPRVNPMTPVLAPGDPEKEMYKYRSTHGIPISDYLYDELKKLLGRPFKQSLISQ